MSLTYASPVGRRGGDGLRAASPEGNDPAPLCVVTTTVSNGWCSGSRAPDPFGSGPMFHEVVVLPGRLRLPAGPAGRGNRLVLSPELVEPWATGGIPAVVYGPTGGKGAMIDSFIGPQG